LHARDDSADINGLIERGTHAKRVHAVLNLADQFIGDALLHQQPRTGAANLSLVEPDAVDQAFDGAVEVRVFKDDEGGFPTEFEGEFFCECGRWLCGWHGRLRWSR